MYWNFITCLKVLQIQALWNYVCFSNYHEYIKFQGCKSGIDGCVDYKQLDDPARSIYSKNNSDSIRDSGNTKDWSGDSWYRFISPAGVNMSDTPPPKGTSHPCGATYGGWVKGTHPTNVGDIVKTNVCFTPKSGFTNCYDDYWTYHYLRKTILIKNCGDYFVYYLTDTSNSYIARYCGQ